MKKRSLALLLSGLLATGALSGCSDNSGLEESALDTESDKQTLVEDTAKDADTKKADNETDSAENKTDSTVNEADSAETDSSDLPQWATGQFEVEPADGILDLSGIGMTIEIPDDLKDRQDRIKTFGMLYADIAYVSIYMTDPDDPDNMDFEIARIEARDKYYAVEEFVDEDYGLSADVFKDLGQNGIFYYMAYDYNLWYANDPSYLNAYIADASDDKKEEYLEYLGYSSMFIENVTFVDYQEPREPGVDDFDNQALLDLEITDLDGNPVVVGDYIKDNKVTLINFWATFCGPCINEMPELAIIEQEYKDKGFEILGMTCDIVDSDDNIDEDILLDALDILKDTGVEYPVFIATNELIDYSQLSAYPTTLIVDSEGKLLMNPIVGSHTREEWIVIIEQALELAN